MTTAAEALQNNESQMQAALDSGLDTISNQTQVAFRKYTKYQFTQDGSVFWVATSEVVKVGGSLHYAIDRVQEEDQTIAVNHVLLTAKSPIVEFNAMAPQSMYIGVWPLGPGPNPPTLQIAFSVLGNYFKQADIWHYSGFAVYPAMQAQLVASESSLPVPPIVSNSLPIWMALPFPWTNPSGAEVSVPVYPSFLVPDNVKPPYIVAHIPPEMTETLQSMPTFQPPAVVQPNTGASPIYELAVSALCRDQVEFTLYGFNNQMAYQYLMMLYEASLTTQNFGFANSPVPRDAKRTQAEIAALAQKKTFTILANYDQGTANAVAYRLILEAMVSGIYTKPGETSGNASIIFSQSGNLVNA